MDTEIEIRRYYEDFRNTPDGQALLARPDGGRSRASSCAATAGQRWTMMTDAQKAVSFRFVCDVLYDGSRC
jgi:hypothetical protein